MILHLFSLPNDEDKITKCKLGEISNIIRFEFDKYFCKTGTFALEIPSDSECADKIMINTLIYSQDDDLCFIAKNIKRSETSITITGCDLNGMLLDRLTMPAPEEMDKTDPKDLITGTTETCVKHFVDYNMINSPSPERNYPRFAVCEDMSRGIPEDSYYCGKECVEDVVRALCESANLGYRIRLNVDQTRIAPDEPLILFDVAEQIDKSAGQSERNRVIFSAGLHNIVKTEREVGISDNKNALWCDAGSIHDGFVFEENTGETEQETPQEIPASWNRREEYVSLSVADKNNADDIVLYGRREMTDKFAITDSLTVEAGNPLDFGSVYDVGDIVTVYDSEKKVQLDSVISAATVKRSETEFTVKITLGESKPKLLDRYATQNDLLKKNQRNYPATQNGKYTEYLRHHEGGNLVTSGVAGIEVYTPSGNSLGNLAYASGNVEFLSFDGYIPYEYILGKEKSKFSGWEFYSDGRLHPPNLGDFKFGTERDAEGNIVFFMEAPSGKRIYFDKD